MRWPAFYLLAGLAFTTYRIYGTDTGAVMRRAWERRAIARSEIVWLTLGIVIWPLSLVLGVFGHLLLPRSWLDEIGSAFRRSYMDREGMFEPQMPAPRCAWHGVVLRDGWAPCEGCGAPTEIVDCDACLRERPDIKLVWCSVCSKAST